MASAMHQLIGPDPLALLPLPAPRTGPPAGVARPDPAPRPAVALLWLAVAATTCFRLWLAVRYPLEENGAKALLRGLEFQFPQPERDLAVQLHAPLPMLLRHLWLRALTLTTAAPGLVALRLPGLLLSPVPMLLLARIGRWLRAPWAGLSAALMYGFLVDTALLATMQENYLLELAAGLWVAERACAWVALRERAYPSLAAAAGLSLWCGYMNVVVLAPLALLIGAEAVARRRWRGVARSVPVALALVLPPACLAWASGVAFLSATPRGRVDAAAYERIVREVGHVPFEFAGSFSRGEFLGAWRLVPAALFGGVPGALIFAAGFALLALSRPALALVAAAVISAFALASTRVALLYVNYSVLLPWLLMATALGFDALPRALAASSAGRWRHAGALSPAVHLTVAAAVVAVGWSHRPPRGGPPEYWDPRPFERALARDAALPVLAYGTENADDAMFYVCRRRGGLEDALRCTRLPGEVRERVGMLDVSVHAGREVASAGWRADACSSATESLRQLALRPGWGRGFVTLSTASPHTNGSCGSREGFTELERLLDARCDPWVGLGLHRFRRCDGARAESTIERPDF